MAPLEGWPRPIFVTPQKTRGIKYHPNLSDSDRDGLVLDTFGICLWGARPRLGAVRAVIPSYTGRYIYRG